VINTVVHVQLEESDWCENCKCMYRLH